VKAIGIIPSRYASTRFPGKPLVTIHGKTMIRLVYEQALKSKMLDEVVVATDDERIAKEVESFKGKVVMTGTHHGSGTERCLEAIEKLGNKWDVIVNIQGDEPFIHPEQIDKVVSCFSSKKDVQISTLACKMVDTRQLNNPSAVKIVTKLSGEALYFSRSAVPFCMKTEGKPWTEKHTYLEHVGLYAYRPDVLAKIVKLEQSPLEITESLEQLRWLEHGFSIYVELTDKEAALAIDTPEDLQKII
jgi:3-deoxy-manno-octulosonate cytidylyltransferase (CMP-KDO synthetase)